jgi:glycerate-2-kinase
LRAAGPDQPPVATNCGGTSPPPRKAPSPSARASRAALARHDSQAVFGAAGTLIETGPTLTNVNDFRAVLLG